MGILDDAIKEHLELKRQHGAGESELQQLEDEAFGAAERPGEGPPDPFAEAPTQFMAQPEVAEAKPEPAEKPAAEEEQAAPARRRPSAEIADLQEPPEPAEEPAPAMEHETIPAGPSTEEREAIAEQPTEMFDVEEELSAGEVEAPSEEDLVEEELSEPRLAPVDPLAVVEEIEEAEVEVVAVEEDEDEIDDDFWDEKRLSDELDQALEAPAEDDEEPEDEEALYEDAGTEDEEGPLAEAPPPARTDEDVLEETPDFLEEAPEDDQLWFEQKPPKDFDFDD